MKSTLQFSPSFVTKNFSFCNHDVQMIQTPSFKQYILDTLIKRYQISWNRLYPKRFHPKRQTSQLQQSLLTVVTKGTPFLLYFTTDPYTLRPLLVFIGTRTHKQHKYPQIILYHGRFDSSLYTDTVLYGQLANSNNQSWSFLVEDIFVYKGTKTSTNFMNRLIQLQTFFTQDYQEDNCLQFCTLRMKQYFNGQDIESCLLYTSPSPRDKRQSRMPSSA